MCLFLSPVLIFDFLVDKIGYCGREDLFFFWSSPIFSGKQDFVDAKTFFFLVFTGFQWIHNKELLTFW